MPTPRIRISTILLVLVPALGCDAVTSLLNRGEEAKTEAKAEAETKTETKTVVKTEVKTETTVAKVEPAKAEPVVATPTVAAAAPVETPVAAAAPAAETPCIVGRWKAIEYLSEIRRAIAKDPTLAKMKRTSSGGLLGYEIGPLADGKGVAKQKAEALRYVFSGKVEGFKVTLTFTLDGEAEAEYTLVGDDTIVVAKPTKNTIVARASGKVEGFPKLSKSPKVEHEFDGTFVYECTDKTLKVWRTKKDGEALDFEREAP